MKSRVPSKQRKWPFVIPAQAHMRKLKDLNGRFNGWERLSSRDLYSQRTVSRL
jgi:hypothetical protein